MKLLDSKVAKKCVNLLQHSRSLVAGTAASTSLSWRPSLVFLISVKIIRAQRRMTRKDSDELALCRLLFDPPTVGREGDAFSCLTCSSTN